MDLLKYPCSLVASIFLLVLERINPKWLDYVVVPKCFDPAGVHLILMNVMPFLDLSHCLSKKRMSFGEVEYAFLFIRRLIP